MRVKPQHLKQGGALLQTIQDDDCISVVYGEGKGCILDVRGEASGAWIPLRGGLQVQNTSLRHSVRVKEILTTERDSHVRAIGHGNSRWLAILGGKRAWELLLADTPAAGVQLLPETHRADRLMRRTAITLVRSPSGSFSESSVYAIADRIAILQSSLMEAIDRCPGRTYANKLQAFLRLQRVRNFISACCDQEIDNDALARMANYSPTHFIRIFNEVFFETPHAYLVKHRLQRAERLLLSGNLAVTEVALASGFENRSAFSRLFRKRFGTTASEARQRFRAVAEG